MSGRGCIQNSNNKKIVTFFAQNLIDVNRNISYEQFKMCSLGLIGPDQVDGLWKPDIYIDGTIDGVN